MKRTIWSNDFDTIQEYAEYLKTEEDYGDYSEYELREVAYEHLSYNLEDIRDMTTVKVGEIIVLADLGLWTGRTMGYKLIGNTLSDVFYSNHDYVTWGIDSYDLVGREVHHDGTNYYTFRTLKEELSDTQVENFLNKIYNGKATKRDISRYTKSLKGTVEELLF